MPLEIGAFFMITYTATNTKTGQFYIGSAKNYCRYMARKGTHHVFAEGRGFTNFQRDLQEDPQSFIWEWSDDGREDRNTEKDLIALYRDSKYLYNVGEGRGGGNKLGNRHSEDTIAKMSASAKNAKAQPAHKKEAQREAMRRTSLNKQPCPQCGMMMGPGNLVKHIKGTRCKGKTIHS